MNHPIREAQRIIQESCDPRPYEMGTGEDIGVLLIHGFTASPTETRPLADYVGGRTAWRCKGILLPGHGDKVESLENSSSAEWLQASINGYLDLAKGCRRIFLAGVSMGAVLCCHVARRYAAEAKVRGLILLSPAFGLTPAQTLGVCVLKHFMRFRNKSIAKANSYVERKLFAYTRIPLRKVEDMVQLGKDAFDHLTELKGIPTLMLAGKKDMTVSVDLIRKAASKNPWICFHEFDRSKHVLTVDADRHEVLRQCLEFMQRQVKFGDGCLNYLNSSESTSNEFR